MAIRSNDPSTGFEWLKQGISLGYRHPRPVFGGAALLLVAVFLPSLITLPLQISQMQAGTQPSPAIFAAIMVVSLLIGMLIVPLYAGYLQVIAAAAQGQPARARDIFAPYRQGRALSIIGFGLVVALIYVAVLGIVILATGGGLATWYMQVLAAQANHQPPPALPSGFGVAMMLCAVFGFFMMGFYAIGFGQVALNRRSALGAVGDGMVGALKNLLPLLVLAASFAGAWIVVAIGIVVVALLLVLIGKLVGMALAFVLILLLYLALILAVFVIGFGVMYFVWRDVCGDDVTTGSAASIAA